MTIEKPETKEPDYSAVVQGGQGRTTNEIITSSLIIAALATISIASFLTCLIIKIIQLG